VVEPGQPAHEKIVEYFGRQVLSEDGTLDRKAVSDIVFKDLEKRKKLESFTHPAIFDLFARRVNEIADRDPEAVIQVAVPLLLELNLQYMFHKLLVVYIPADEQVTRLSKRDGISREESANILKAQLPIEEKPGYADFVIDNSGSPDETRRQVEDLWDRLREIQRQWKKEPK
jgi:dephospho-CoA kinase